MKLHVPFCGHELLLTDKQFEKILTIVSGCEILKRSYRGSGKGFFGPDASYEIEFDTFDHENLSVSIMTQETMDKYKTLIAMREDNKEI